MRIASPSARAVLSALTLGALVLAAMPSGTVAATGGIQYDQLTRFGGMMGNPTPLPDNFDGNFKAAVDASVAFNNRPQGHGIFSAIRDAEAVAKATQAIFKSGMPMTYYYMGNWEREDDPGKQTGTIFRPDRKQIIHLDLAKKTYTIEDMGDRTPPPAAAPQPPQPNEPQESPQPGTAKQDITVSSSLIGPLTVDGTATTGYHSDFKIVTTQATGSCQNGSIEASVDDYVSSIVPPNAQTSDVMRQAMTGMSPAMFAAKGGCAPTTTMHKSVGATAPAGHLALWEILTFKGGQQGANQGQGFSTYIERGHIHILGPGDAGLFDIPPGFTKG
jgi:hypothetical protein